MSCEFNNENCKNCSRFTICSLLNTEKVINNLENQISEIFSSLNQLIEYSFKSGDIILKFQEKVLNKEELLYQFNITSENFEKLKELVILQNSEMKNIILEYSGDLKKISQRLSKIEKAVGLDIYKNNYEKTNQ